MVEIHEQHSLITTASMHSITIQKRLVLLFGIALFGIFLLYVVGVNRMSLMSSDLTMTLKSTKPKTEQTASHDNGRNEIGTSRLPIQLSTYATTSGKTADIQHGVTKWKPNCTPRIRYKSTDELELRRGKDFIGNLIKANFHKSHLITIKLMGRLGNNLFQLAALLSCAKRLNYTAFAPSNELINSYFLLNITNNINLTNVKTFYEKMFGKYDTDIENLDTSINWTLSGYYQSWKYFHKNEDLIRRSLEFRPNIYEPASQFVERFRLNNKTIVGIHVRRGDMTNKESKMLGYATAPLTYINKSMNYFREKYNDTFFIITSDEISWCKENIRGNNDTAFSNFDNPGIDMAMLSSCDHVIITSGTFGWWGAWLAGGDVVYFRGYPRPNSDLDKGMRREDYYPPLWIGME